MNTPGTLERTARALAFGRHIGVGQLARRLELTMRRALRDRLGPVALPRARAVAAWLDRPPAPLFAPRSGRIDGRPGRYRFTFLCRPVEMEGGVAWDGGGDDQLWRMHLHYMEYLEEADDALFAALLADWIAANTPHRSGAWRASFNSYAVSIRVVVWMQQLARRAGRLPAGLVQRATASLHDQLCYLERNLETDIGGNHLVKNAKALVWGASFFAGEPARRWRARGLRLLEAILDKQILADGMHYERSPSYHAQVQADLLECRHALGHDPFDGRLDDALLRMAQVTADLAHPDGGPALFNDAGLTMTYSPAECLEAHARFFGDRPSPRRVFALESAGYYGLGGGDSYLLLDCGRIAPDDLVAHGHADVLSFEWSVAGKRMIVDQGVFEYAAGDRRQRARQAASHNTLSFAGADMADFYAAFRCGRRPNVAVLAYRGAGDGFMLEGTHDGYGHLPGAPRHIRSLEASAGEVLIRDRIEGQPDRPAAIGFLLHPQVRVDLSHGSVRITRDNVSIDMASSLPVTIEEAVWWPDMGCERTTKRLCMRLAPGEREATSSLRIVRPLT